MKRHLAIYERAADGSCGAYVPDLAGCFTLGATREETARCVREAIAAQVKVPRERGEAIPKPSSVAADLIEVAVWGSWDFTQMAFP
jgi:predicted RNase H-like HicB family nuclease